MTQRYRRAVITAPESIDIRGYDLPAIDSGEVLVKVRNAGICTWEQKYFRGVPGSYPFIGGHEIAGEVVETGSGAGQDLKPGDHVVVASLTRCGECYYCRRGMDNLCENTGSESAPGGEWGPGGFGEYFIARGYEVFPISKQVTLAEGTLAEPLACVIRSIDRARLEFGDIVLIQGGGVMGVLHLLLAKARGSRVILSEPDARRRKRAADFGADITADPLSGETAEAVKETTAGRGCDAVFFTAGGAAALREGLSLLRKNGTCVVYGATGSNDIIELDPKLFHYDEIYLTGVTKHTKDGFRKAAELISAGTLGLGRLISEEFPFDHIETAFRRAMEMDTYRVVLNI